MSNKEICDFKKSIISYIEVICSLTCDGLIPVSVLFDIKAYVANKFELYTDFWKES